MRMPADEFRTLCELVLRHAVKCLEAGPQGMPTLLPRFMDAMRPVVEGVEDRTATEVAVSLRHGGT